jgi:glutathione S-transferase
MKLYSDDTSPFCAPVRAAIYAKHLSITIEPPPGGLKSEAYRAASLTGTIPCLILDDGTPLPESAVIIDYLDEKFPDPRLRPGSPEARAKTALIQRLAEGELVSPMVALFHAMNEGRAEAAKPVCLAHFEKGLSLIEALMADDGLIAGPAITTADCILGPALMGVIAWAPGLGKPDLLAEHPKIAGYVGRVSRHPAVAKVLAELQAALAKSGVKLS